MTRDNKLSSTFRLKQATEVDYFFHQPSQIPGTTYIEDESSTSDFNASHLDASNSAGKEIPKPIIFESIKIKDITLPNRIGVSPMCMYSANEKFEVTPFHLVHYGGLVQRGPGITIVEAASVSPEGGLSPSDLGIFNDDQAKKLKEIVDYAHGQRGLIGIQIAHGGRKASGQPMFIHLEQVVDASIGGWPDKVVAPSAIQFRPHGNYHVPIELSIKDIKRIVKEFGDAADRAVNIAGFDIIEIHGAHGYLINEFLSPISNHRTDEYGGSFDNRIRFLLEIIDEVTSRIGNKIPLFLRISAVENTPDPNAWTIEESIKLAEIVAEKGIDVLDVSSGGNDYKQLPRSGIKHALPMHVPHAKAIKEALGNKILVATVGGLDADSVATNEYIEKGYYDIALIGKAFLRNPGLVYKFADDLGVEVNSIDQYEWPFHPNKASIMEVIQRSEALSLQDKN